MPTLRINHCDIHFEQTGGGDETIVFSHGLLWSTRLFDPQVAALSSDYRCIAWDHRGQGRSEVPDTPSIDMETLYCDAVRLIESLNADPCHFVGLSMGGFVGQRVAARRPDLLASLTLLDTAADPEPAANASKYKMLTAAARVFGIGVVSSRVMPILFGQTFLEDPQRAGERAKWKAELEKNERSIYKAVNGVLYRPGIEFETAQIEVPTLILRGEEDDAISAERHQQLARLIEPSELHSIPEAGHSATVENPAAVNEHVRDFLKSI